MQKGNGRSKKARQGFNENKRCLFRASSPTVQQPVWRGGGKEGFFALRWRNVSPSRPYDRVLWKELLIVIISTHLCAFALNQQVL